MSNISPFKALRPRPEVASLVASPPYDVLDSREAKLAAANNKYSFLNVTKSEITLEGDFNPYSSEVYEKAASNLRAMIVEGILVRESLPAYYVYRLEMNGRSQTGLVCTSSVDDYEREIIKKHEFTRPEKENDRINHIKTTGAQTGNVFLAYRQVFEIDEIIEQYTLQNIPLYSFSAEDGVKHEIWTIDLPETIAAITLLFAEKVPFTYIADGHHRAASAAKVRNSISVQDKKGADFFLTTLFPSNQLHIMDYNRTVQDLNGMEESPFLRALEEKFEVRNNGLHQVKPERLHSFGMYLGKNWYELKAREGTFTNDPIGILDVTILQENILSPLLGITDPRTDKRIDFIGGIRGLGALEDKVKKGMASVAFSLFPVSIGQLFDIADSGNVMPPKSTWFEPKLRDGLLTHLIFE